MKQEYIDQLSESVKLKVMSPFRTSNDHHDIECLLCGRVFNATPKSKWTNFKKWGARGCPECTDKARKQKDSDRIMHELKDKGIELLEEYKNNKRNHRMKNTNCCGRVFTAKPNNILTGATTCPPCNDDVKRQRMLDHNEERHQEAQKYRKGFHGYSKRVRVLTERTYREHKDIINPNGFIRMRSGQPGYHLDHIESIYRCYHTGIAAEVCAHHTNLQMLPWKENAQKYKN